MSFWGELRRRNVVKVGAAYLIVAWLIAQIVSVIHEPMALPDWFDTTVLAFLAIGFPFALLFAWAFEVTPQGIKKTRHVPLEQSITHLTSQKLNYIVTGLLVLAVGFMAIDDYLLENSASPAAEPDTASAPRERAAEGEPLVEQQNQLEALPNSIAVLPFDNLSPNPEDAYFAPGLHDEILSQLARLDIQPIARTSVMRYADASRGITEIGRELNVETVMEGSVSYAEGRVAVRVKLFDAKTGAYLWGNSYNREFADWFGIQGDIARNIATALEAEFSTEEQRNMERSPTDSLEAYEFYLAARAQLGSDNLNGALQAIEAALALDPDFALAWATKSSIHSRRQQDAPADVYGEEREAILNSALRAIEIAPSLAEAQAMLATARGQRGDWHEAETAYRRGYETTGSWLPAYRYAIHLLAVGNIEKARDVLEVARQNNPLDSNTRWFHALTFALLGETQQAEEEFEQATTLLGTAGLRNWFITLGRLGANGRASADEIPMNTAIHNEARQHLESPSEGLRVLREHYSSGRDSATPDLLAVAVWAAYFGDPELALDVMKELMNRNAQNAFNFWIPSMRDVRQLPEFEEFIREVGLVDYWNDFGWPAFCRPLGNEDFECSE